MDDYYLSSEAASGVKPQSQLSVISQSAALSSGRLQAIFEVSLSFAGSALKSVGLIYAAGPVDSTGALEQHTYVTTALPWLSALKYSSSRLSYHIAS